MVNIAVIGAGPKAAAVAAKAEILNRIADTNLDITIFEKGVVGNNWRGPHEYTNGEQQICTPAERDVGFPYDSKLHPKVPLLMQARYSWMAYAVSRSDQTYSDWINRGNQRPTHEEFADYIKYVIDESGATCLHDTEVGSLSVKNKKWIVSTKASPVGPPKEHPVAFDGVVVTGPGPAKRSVAITGALPGYYDCANVWGKLSEVEKRLREHDEDIVIVGGGGAAAAIAAWLVQSGSKKRTIRFIAPQATFYTRTGGLFENRVFDDEDLWSRLGKKEQKEFEDRITKGVVWDSVYDILAGATQLEITPGRAVSVTKAGDDTVTRSAQDKDLLIVTFNPAAGGDAQEVEASIVIDASGFDTWWFARLLPSPYNSAARLTKAAENIAPDLRLPLGKLPPLHVPNVASAIGPGYASLMVLGRMSDRILRNYVQFG